MEPLSITAACVGLISGLFTVSDRISSLVNTTKRAQSEFSGLQSELDLLQRSLTLFYGSGLLERCPNSHVLGLKRAFRQCSRVASELDTFLTAHTPRTRTDRLRWALLPVDRAEVTRLRQRLEAHKISISIACSATEACVVRDVASDTSSIRRNAAQIPALTQRIADLEAVLQTTVQNHQGPNVDVRTRIHGWFDSLGSVQERGRPWQTPNVTHSDVSCNSEATVVPPGALVQPDSSGEEDLFYDCVETTPVLSDQTNNVMDIQQQQRDPSLTDPKVHRRVAFHHDYAKYVQVFPQEPSRVQQHAPDSNAPFNVQDHKENTPSVGQRKVALKAAQMVREPQQISTGPQLVDQPTVINEAGQPSTRRTGRLWGRRRGEQIQPNGENINPLSPALLAAAQAFPSFAESAASTALASLPPVSPAPLSPAFPQRSRRRSSSITSLRLKKQLSSSSLKGLLSRNTSPEPRPRSISRSRAASPRMSERTFRLPSLSRSGSVSRAMCPGMNERTFRSPSPSRARSGSRAASTRMSERTFRSPSLARSRPASRAMSPGLSERMFRSPMPSQLRPKSRAISPRMSERTFRAQSPSSTSSSRLRRLSPFGASRALREKTFGPSSPWSIRPSLHSRRFSDSSESAGSMTERTFRASSPTPSANDIFLQRPRRRQRSRSLSSSRSITERTFRAQSPSRTAIFATPTSTSTPTPTPTPTTNFSPRRYPSPRPNLHRRVLSDNPVRTQLIRLPSIREPDLRGQVKEPLLPPLPPLPSPIRPASEPMIPRDYPAVQPLKKKKKEVIMPLENPVAIMQRDSNVVPVLTPISVPLQPTKKKKKRLAPPPRLEDPAMVIQPKPKLEPELVPYPRRKMKTTLRSSGPAA